jgi:MFS family permease
MTRADPIPTSRSHAVGRPPWRVLPIVLLGNVLAVLDFFVVNVALPAIDRDLDAGPAALELLVAGYAAAYASGLVTFGRLGDAWGRKRLFIGGMTAFTLASAACAIAPTAILLVLARLAQGLAASVMVPQVLASVQALFTGAGRQRALGVFGVGIGFSTVAGQVLGAALVTAFGWRAIFLVNLPLGLVGVIAAARWMPEIRSGARARLDVPGAVLLAVTLVALLVPLALGVDLGWPLWCRAVPALALVTGAVLAVTQIRRERAGGLPLLPPSVLRLPAMHAGLLAVFLFFLACGGFLFTVSVVLQRGLGAEPMTAGLALAPYATGFLLASASCRPLVARFGGRVIVTGAALSSLALVVLAAQLGLDLAGPVPLGTAPAMAVSGVGQAMVMIPLFGVVLAGLPAARAGLASGVLTTTQQVGLGLGAAGLGTLLFTVLGPEQAPHDWPLADVTVFLVEAALFAATALAVHRVAAAGRTPRT